MIGWLKKLLGRSPVDGEAGRARGYTNTVARVRAGMSAREAAEWWVNADCPRDDYDRGVLDALADSGFKDPSEVPHEGC